jgi:excisionase family DNA binding protein
LNAEERRFRLCKARAADLHVVRFRAFQRLLKVGKQFRTEKEPTVRTTRSETGGRPVSRSNPRDPLLDADGVAKALGVTNRHIRRLVAERRIPFFKVGKFVRFDPGELDVWLDQQRVEMRRSSPSSRAAGR